MSEKSAGKSSNEPQSGHEDENADDNLAYIGVPPDLSTGSGSSTSGEDDLDSTVHEDFPNVDPSRIILRDSYRSAKSGISIPVSRCSMLFRNKE